MQSEEFYEIVGDQPMVECPVPFCDAKRDSTLEMQEHIHDDHTGYGD